MLKMSMSRAASGLLRALIERGGDQSNRILLSEIQSVDWRSLTFIGETHLLKLRVTGPGVDRIIDRLTNGLEDAQFAIPGHLVADIAVAGRPAPSADGSVTIAIEALTIAD